MNESRNIDIEDLRRSPWEKVCGRMDVLFGWLRKRGWREAEAEVIGCVATNPLRYQSKQEPWIGGYAVTFAYRVDGRDYEGTTISPEKVEAGEKMTIRYNPRHPAQNNSFDSETDWAEPAAKLEEVLVLCLLLFAVVVYFVAGR